MSWPKRSSFRRRTRRIAIIGSGFSGLCVAIHLKKAGIRSFTIFEKENCLGGTWRDNTYPGAACDVPSFAYCFSFEQKTDWTQKWSPHSEILAYMEECAQKYGIVEHVRFGTAVEAARFDDATGMWRLSTSDGAEVEADVVVSAVGQLNRPNVPAISGLERFEGASFHSARWDHGVDLAGRRVAVIGNAASAVQLVPEIAPKVKQLHVFQRTPNWLVPRGNRAYRPWERWLFRNVPGVARAYRWLQWARGETQLLPAIRGRGLMSRLITWAAKQHLRAAIPDPALRKVLTPDYPIGGKRVLITDDYYPTLLRENVELVTAGIDHLTEDAIVTRDGASRPVDVVIFATGFRTTELLAPMRIEGRGGLSLEEAWKDGAQAYRGITVSGFPNFFLTYGPNTNLGHNSILFMIECQTRYLMEALRTLDREDLAWLDLRPDAMRSYNERIQAELATTAWARTDRSWYKNEAGRITNNWPGSTVRYWWNTRRFDGERYELASRSADAASRSLPPRQAAVA